MSHKERKVLAVNPSVIAQFNSLPQCCTEHGDYARFFLGFVSWFSEEAHFKIEGAARFRKYTRFFTLAEFSPEMLPDT